MKNKLILLIAFIVLIFIFLILFLNISEYKEKNSLKTLSIGETYNSPMGLFVNQYNSENNAELPVFELEPGIEVVLLETLNEFSKIQLECKEGWIPSWYLTREAKHIKMMNEELMLIGHPSNIYLYPNAPKSMYDGYELEKGKVVRIKTEYKDWYCIDYITYDCPNFNLVWIKKKSLMKYNPDIAKEGYVEENTLLYNENGTKTEYTIVGPVTIIDEVNDLYNVVGGGGNQGYIKKEDFLFYNLQNFPNQSKIIY